MRNPAPFHPSLVHPDLTDERLQFLAALFVDCRAAALRKHDPDAGEDAWCLGCRSYARICKAISEAAASDSEHWLRVIQDRTPGEHFIFQIGQVPFRFYTGQPSRPTLRTRRIDARELSELKQLDLGFDDGSSNEKWFWRIAIGVKADGHVGQVCVLQVTERGSVRNVYAVPFEGAVTMENATDFLAPAIEIEGADVSLIEEHGEGEGVGRGGGGSAHGG